MRKTFTNLIGLATALTLTVVACGDDVTGSSGDELTPTEVNAIFAALSLAFADVGAAAPAAGPAQAPIIFDQSITLTAQCDLGGNIVLSGSLSGSIDDVTFASDINFTVIFDPNACIVSDGTNTFTVEGDPDITLVLDIVTAGTTEAFTASGTEKGGFTYTSSDGRSGGCKIDVTYSIVGNDAGVETIEISGTVCGQDADAFETFGD